MLLLHFADLWDFGGTMPRLCVVVGGSRGIGRAVAALLAEKSQRVVVLSRNLDAARAAAASLPGGNTHRTGVLMQP